MKLVIGIFAAVAWLQISAASEGNSILYPKQIQPKLTTRERCQLDDEWKRYGSLKECIDEKRHEEVVSQQKKALQRQEELADESIGEQRKTREAARSLYELEKLQQGVQQATGSSH